MLLDDVKYSSKKVLDSIEMNFATGSNPALYHYYENDRLWKLIMESIKDELFMRVVIYNNKYLSIAPVHTFCSYFIDDKHELSSYEKNSVGRIFKFIFNHLGFNDSYRVYRKSSSVKYGKVFIKKVKPTIK